MTLSCPRRINTYAKGNRNQNKARKFYESLGYEVEVVRRTPYRTNQDFFGLWDLICVGDHDIIFCQVKTNKDPSSEWQEKATNWGPDDSVIQKEYVVYKDYSRGNVPSGRVIFGMRD